LCVLDAIAATVITQTFFSTVAWNMRRGKMREIALAALGDLLL
jgi:hypothetical protein